MTTHRPTTQLATAPATELARDPHFALCVEQLAAALDTQPSALGASELRELRRQRDGTAH